MNGTLRLSLSLALILPTPCVLADSNESADEFTGVTETAKSAAFFAPPDSPDHFKYAPDREVDMLHLALEVTPDFKARTVHGTATLKFRPMVKPVDEIKLDAVDLNVESVTSTEKVHGHQSTDDQLIITFADPVPAGKEVTVAVTYRAEPAQGLYFRTPEMGYKDGDTHLFSQGEEIEARHWFPCFDAPNEKFTSEITCHVPEGMTVVSNGRLISQDKDSAGLVAFHWSQEKPHANYLITLVAGYFKALEDKHRDVPLAFLTPPSESAEAANSFRDTRDIMAFFEDEIGVPYPWPKYYQICVNDFVAGGMENTSATTLTDSTLFTDATENIRNSDGLISHEMAHQWFGDLVTCKDWSHIWLNEGFATYYQVLYDGHKFGHDSMLYSLYGNARQIMGVSDDVNPIVRRDYSEPNEMFGYLAYPKGCWVLHMLRSQLGADLYRKCISTYLKRHEYGNVTSEDLRAVIEELSGRSFDQFFDQWLYHAHYPELDASYSWDEKTHLAKVTIRQTQNISDRVLLFNFPLTVRFHGSFGTKDNLITVKNKEEDFYFPLAAAPETVRLDPEYTLLAKINFKVPDSMLAAQLTAPDDMMGRLLAVLELGDKKDKDSVEKLKQALNSDGFYGVRLDAARALRSIHTDDALDALLASQKQSDARVRRQVVVDIGDFYRDSSYDAARQVIAAEKNPDVLGASLTAIAGYAKTNVEDTLVKYVNSQSYRNELAVSAIEGIRTQDDPALAPAVQRALKDHEADFTSPGLSRGLSTLAYLERNEEQKDGVNDFLIGYVNSKKLSVRVAAIRALGTLGDSKAIPVLQKFARASRNTPEQRAAEQSVNDLRAARRPVDDFKNLRQEVLDLQRENRDLRKSVDELKKEVEAGKTAAPVPLKKSTKPKSGTRK